MRGLPSPEHVIRDRRKRVRVLWLRGMPKNDIADQMGVTLRTIQRDIKRIAEEWAPDAEVFEQRRVRQLQRLDDLWDRLESGEPSLGVTRMQILEREAALLGLDAPKRVAEKVDVTIEDRHTLNDLMKLWLEVQHAAVAAPRPAATRVVEVEADSGDLRPSLRQDIRPGGESDHRALGA